MTSRKPIAGTDSPPHIGGAVGERFTLQEPLGEGRFAIVYRAQDTHTQHPVALKLLREEHIDGDPKWREAFHIEVDLLQKMADVPTVVRMLDYGLVNENRPYISLELLPPGADLLTRVTHQGGFSETDGLPIAWQLADLLRITHARHIAYRDLKLEHVWWSDGRMTLIDWNVSRQLSDAGASDGDFEARWEREYNFQSDLFKLGTIFYSLFTGLDIRDRQVPTPVHSQLEAHGLTLTDEGIVWPIDFGDAPLSSELKDIICRLVHIDLHQRYQTAAELSQDLENHARRLGITLKRPTPLPSSHQGGRKGPHRGSGRRTSKTASGHSLPDTTLTSRAEQPPSARHSAGPSTAKDRRSSATKGQGLLNRLYRAMERVKDRTSRKGSQRTI